MTKKLKIAFVGAQCSAKTTSLLYVMSELKLAGIGSVAMIEELARRCPYPINQSGTIEAQNWMLLNQILSEQQLCGKYDVVLSDRSVVDPIIYAYYLSNGGHIDEAQGEYLVKVMDAWLELAPYDAIFFFEPLPIQGDVDRPADAEFQSTIHQMFERFFEQASYTICRKFNLIRVNQSDRDERRKFVLAKIKEMLQ